MRRTVGSLVALTLLVSGLVTGTFGSLIGAGAGTPAHADTAAMPGDFTGYAFDTCRAPSQREMDRWRTHSPFWGIGIYVAGMNRACDKQPNLDASWVETQARKGWRLLPLVVGRQASCAPAGMYQDKRISDNPTQDYAEARDQGSTAAVTGVEAAQRLGIGRGSVLWFDLEHFDTSVDSCRESALAFLSAWTSELARRGYLSGLYSSASSGITMVDQARQNRPGEFVLPDYLWLAEWNGSDSLESRWISEDGWWPHRRVHQYVGDHDETHGGITLNIDSNVMSTGVGTRPGRVGETCGVRLDFPRYRRLTRGDQDPQVAAAHCLLRQHAEYGGPVKRRFTAATERAVRRFQSDRAGIPATGRLSKSTWAALLSTGPKPVLKAGSGGLAVRHLQRALNAASNARLDIDGIFAEPEMEALQAYQQAAGLPTTGVASATTWEALRRGTTVGTLPIVHDRDLERLLEQMRTVREAVPFSSGAAGRG